MSEILILVAGLYVFLKPDVSSKERKQVLSKEGKQGDKYQTRKGNKYQRQ
uniref:Uncharacterized protein n=1 Tax=Arundo donax TaxID=35708 RepID=A0A0A8Z609_ARUDO